MKVLTLGAEQGGLITIRAEGEGAGKALAALEALVESNFGEQVGMKTIQGIAASRGIGIGPAFHLRQADLCFERYTVENSPTEWARCQAALETDRKQLADVYTKAETESGIKEAAILQAHAMMLEDPELLETVRTAIEEQGITPRPH